VSSIVAILRRLADGDYPHRDQKPRQQAPAQCARLVSTNLFM